MTKKAIMIIFLSAMLCATGCGGNKYPVRTIYVYAEDTQFYGDATMTGEQAVELIQAQSDSIRSLESDAKAFIKTADYHLSRLRKQLEHCRR